MELSELYKAFSDQSRLRILNSLRRGRLNVQELTSVLGLAQPTVSHHLKILQAAGLVCAQREGTWIYYALSNSDKSRADVQLLENFLKLALNPVAASINGSSDRFASDTLQVEEILNIRRDRMRSFFDRVAPSWKDLREQADALSGGADTLSMLAKLIPTDCAFLELGCGSGALLEKILPRPGNTLAIDSSPKMIAEAGRILSEKNLSHNVDLRLGFLEHLPVADAIVDVVAGYMVFHHLSAPKDALRDIARVLRPGGELFIVDLIRHQDETMRERFADLWLGFDQDEVVGWLNSSGFSVTCREVWARAFFIRASKLA